MLCPISTPEPRRHLFPLEYRSKNEGRVEEARRSALLPLGPIPEPVHLSVFWDARGRGEKKGRGDKDRRDGGIEGRRRKLRSEEHTERNKAVLGDAGCVPYSFQFCCM